MRELTREWIVKAEGDWRTANREMRARRAPNYDAVCFHSQQCAEKYLKAFLQEHGHPISRIHDLNQLLELCLVYDGTLELHRDLLKELTRYAIEFRYPGESALKEDAHTAVHHLKIIRAFLRPKFK
jgi:HEPN domain-containing protein